MDLSTMEQYWVWLSSVEGIGPKRFYQLISIYEDARAVWDLSLIHIYIRGIYTVRPILAKTASISHN